MLLIQTFNDVEYGVHVEVFQRPDGKFLSHFVDTDSGEVIENRIFNDYEACINYSRKLVSGYSGSISVEV